MVDGRHHLVGGRGDDRATTEWAPFGVVPYVPQGGEDERSDLRSMKIKGLLAVTVVGPRAGATRRTLKRARVPGAAPLRIGKPAAR